MDRRLAAIMVADIVGYSRLIEADETATLAAVDSWRREIFTPLMTEHHGRVVKLMGDGALVEFASAVNAVECAVQLQRRMAKANEGTPEARRLWLRIGINLGDVVVDGSDIQGDGVNVAARLEAMAEPGGICISAGVFEQVARHIPENYEDLGEQKLKNISRPVRAYRLGDRAAVVAGGAGFPSPAKPSIVVLPFVNMSGDANQEYFANGITENIITELARFRDLLVIASTSSFAYKGKAKKIQDVSRELDVRYVLEGSIQRSGERVRVTAQLIDGATGRHLWAERYDRPASDVFKVQDDVTETIVGTLASAYGGRLRKAWRGRSDGSDSRSLQALDHFQRGVEFADRFTREDCRRGREQMRKAIELDPNYGKAYAKLAWLHMFDALYGWAEENEQPLTQTREFAALAIERDDDEAWGHWVMGAYRLLCGEADHAVEAYHRALELNPNDADVLAEFGSCLSYVGRHEEAREAVQKAIRLNPHHPEWYLYNLGQIFFDARQYAQAIATLKKLREFETIYSLFYLAASHGAAGHAGEGAKVVKRALEIDPTASLADLAKTGRAPYRKPEDLAHFRESLRRAGVPEVAQGGAAS
jgi:adenylate cyclase